ncbi:DUF6301 family protein [Nocardia pseudobrasiliensis]|uniref:DUF6301 family protein n=1 Tax=Nocardia pseudobrasiliensis TaxID=45979 RepID=UPI0008296211|nr:DUF6301 family protein [Nocardia pseudobrasiliensis]
MTETVGEDLPGAIEIISAAAEFEWDWTREQIPRLAERLGWREPEPKGPRYSWFWTTLAVRNPVAQYQVLMGDDIFRIVVNITDKDLSARADRKDRPVDQAALVELTDRMRTEWGEPSRRDHVDASTVWWDLPGLTFGLAPGTGSIDLVLMKPAQARQLIGMAVTRAEAERKDAERAAALTDSNLLLAVIPLLAQADPGDWSRTAVARLLDATDWDSREEDRSSLSARSRTDTVDARFIASRTGDYIDRGRFGLGEFESLWTTHHFAPAVLDTVHATALAECRRQLGTPTLVGGPGALAIWRRPDTTLTLSRDLRNSSITVQLTPTEPTERYVHWQWDCDDDWRAEERWLVCPDVENPVSGAALKQMWGHPEQGGMGDSVRLERDVVELFTSLGADLPVLHPYATKVVWIVQGPADGFVQGYFCADERICRVESWARGEQTRSQEFPLGFDGGARAAAIVLAALGEPPLANRLEELRCEAWAEPKPQRLWTIRFGI